MSATVPASDDSREVNAPEGGVVLLIEDDANHRYLFAYALRHAGYEVIEAPDGVRGLAEAQARRPDLVVVDLGLPDLDGFQVLQVLRARRETRDVPVLVVTVHTDKDAHARSATLGATLHVDKPVRLESLVLAVRRLIALGPRQGA